LGTGLYLTIGLKLLPQRKLPYGIRMTLAGRKADDSHPGDITPFQALTTALSATVGTGNIAGVATAIALGGPGAVFWMWITALVGMATKYAEAVLAVTYRDTDARGEYIGGPMYYIRNGMGRNWAWLAWLFALFATVAAFGIGNTVQANSVAHALEETFKVPTAWTGITMAILAFMVIIGGIKRIGTVAERLVPLMAIFYVGAAGVVILINIAEVPATLAMIVSDAFTGTAATGGFAGAAVWAALRFGVARGIFSNEAGLGSAPIAHAAARTNEPVRQGTVAMLGTFIDTIIVCTMTGLVLIVTGVWNSGAEVAALTKSAFDIGLPGNAGGFIVSFGIIFFAYSTILGWAYYGEKCMEYLAGVRAVLPYRLIYSACVAVGATIKLDLVWNFADVMNGLMAIPNLIGLVGLSGVIVAETNRFLKETGGTGREPVTPGQ
jgi:AGCS family alanine or glycine:cation symporter